MVALSSPSDISGLLGSRPRDPSTEFGEQALRSAHHEEALEDAEETWAELTEENPFEDAPAESLIDYVMQAFEDARSARTASGIDETIVSGRRMAKGEYSCEERAKMPEIDVWFQLVSSISNIALAFLRSVLTQTDEDNPLWELRHSPIPELPSFVVERAAEFAALRVQQEAQLPDPETGIITPITEERAVEIVNEVRSEIFEAIDREADVHTRNLHRAVTDAYSKHKGNFDEVLDQFLRCLVIDPVACIKGPTVSAKKIPEWRNGRKVYPRRKYQHYEVIDAQDIFPSPDATGPNDGAFIIHLKQMTRRDLIDAQRLKGFVSENIEIVLKTYETQPRDWLNPIESEIDVLEDRCPSWRDYEGIDVIEYHGEVPGLVLTRYGLTKLDGKAVEDTDSYEVEVWVTGREIIRAVAACNESGRPFACASLYPCKGSFWGESIPQRAADEQRAANAALRAAIRDMGYSSAPIFQTDVSMLDESEKVPNRLHAGINIKVNSRKRGVQGKAVTVDQIASQAGSFLAIVDKFFLNAEMTTGINRQMMGQAQPGVATLGESQILQGNAVTSLRSMLVEVDRVIEHVTEMTACQIMETTDDPSMKSDARVVAKGSRHLLERQLNQANLLQLLNTFVPLSQTQPGLFEPHAMACLVREIASSFGQDPDKFIRDPEDVERRSLEMLMIRQAAGAPAPGAQGTPSAPGLAGGPAQAPQVLDINAARPSLEAAPI